MNKIGDRADLCEQDTSYRGDVLDHWETFLTPVGIVERHYWARGAGLERAGTDWRLVPATEIAEAQERFTKASTELAEATAELQMLVAKIVPDSETALEMSGELNLPKGTKD